MDVLECISSRRSIRDFSDRKIPKVDVENILQAGALAPSAMHVLPWNFIVVEDKAKLEELSQRAMGQYNKIAAGIAAIAFLKGKTLFHNAPLAIFIVCKENGDWFREDSALAAENMFLAARALGIGSCWIGMAHRLNETEESRQALGVPKGYKIFAALAFGYPAKEWPEAEERKPNVLSWI